jgi:hypothetical protein
MSYASTLFDSVDHLQYPMDIDAIQHPSSIHMSDLDSIRSTPPSPLPPPLRKGPQIVPLPLIDPEEDSKWEYRRAWALPEPSKADLALIGKVSRLSKKVIAYAWDFLTDWLKQAVDKEDNKNPINDWDAKIASQPSWTGAASSSTTLSPPSYKSKSLHEVEDLEAPGQGWI